MKLVEEFLPELMQDAETLHAARKSGRPGGPVSGLSLLDRELCGWFRPGLHVLVGAPGSAKSALALQIAASSGRPALFVNAEQSHIEILKRLISRRTGEYLGRLKSGELSPFEMQALAVRACEGLKLYLAENATVEAIAEAIADIEARHGAKPLVIVDSLQAWARQTGAGISLSEYELLEESIGALASLAREQDVALILVSHRNRASNRATNGGGMHGAKGSGSAEYLSETLIALECEEGQTPDTKGETEITLKIWKNRHGYSGAEIPLKFEGRRQAFREV
jgi:replicative DNA helicase